jgi:hypothetical protein
MEIGIRRAEPDDYEALHRIFSGPRVVEGTLQLPFPPAQTRCGASASQRDPRAFTPWWLA